MSSQQTPFSYFGNTLGVQGKNIWSSKKDDQTCIGSGLLNDPLIINCPNRSKFVYKSGGMVRSMTPSGVWHAEIVDDQHIVFRRSEERRVGEEGRLWEGGHSRSVKA